VGYYGVGFEVCFDGEFFFPPLLVRSNAYVAIGYSWVYVRD
jgi:hypothetical protein